MSLYDPLDAAYADADATRAERDRTFQICSDCRICVRFCPSFKDLFRLIDEREGASNVAELSDADHDVVVDECYQCKLCYIACPYTPEREQEWKVDFPRLMLRSLVIAKREGKVSRSARLLAQTDATGKVATTLSGVVNRVSRVSLVRKAIEQTAGIASDRLLPTYARVRFSRWFAERRAATVPRRGRVAMFPTCLVEYQDPGIGRALVEVYEHNGWRCELPDGQMCCGMPWLDAGDAEKFTEHARRNVEVLAPSVRDGTPVVVPQPTCAYVLRKEYPDFLGTAAARLVAENTFDASEFLMNEHRTEPLETGFDGRTYETITWQAACHYRAQQIGPRSKQLMELTGARVETVERCSAIDGTWGLRAENVEMARTIAKPLMTRVTESDAELIAGDCHLANTAITEATGRVPRHPLQVLARAYGLDDGTSG